MPYCGRRPHVALAKCRLIPQNAKRLSLGLLAKCENVAKTALGQSPHYPAMSVDGPISRNRHNEEARNRRRPDLPRRALIARRPQQISEMTRGDHAARIFNYDCSSRKAAVAFAVIITGSASRRRAASA